MIKIILLLCLATSQSNTVKNPYQIYLDATTLCHEGRWTEAITLYEKLISPEPYHEEKPHPEKAYRKEARAKAPAKKEVTAKTVEFLDDAHFWIGYCYIEVGDYKKALKIFKKFLKEFTGSEYADDAEYKIGEIYEKYLHNYGDAIKSYKRLVEKYATSNLALQSQLRQAEIQERIYTDFDKAITDYKKVESLNKAQNLTQSSWYAKTAKERIEFIKENSDFDWKPLKMYNQTLNKETKGLYDDALGGYRKLLEKYPDSNVADDAQFRIAEILKEQKKDKLSIEAYKLLVEKYPDSKYVPIIKTKNLTEKEEK